MASHNKIPIEEVKKRLFEVHGNSVTIKEETLIGIGKKASFIDIEYGEWLARVDAILSGQHHPMRAKINRAKTNIEKYGVDNPVKSKEIRQKSSDTMMKKYGFSFYTQSPEMILKSRATCMAKYGVENASKDPEVLKKISSSQTKNYKVNHWKTNEELICQGSWEKATIEWLNNNQIQFIWKPKSFVTNIKSIKTNNYKTYNPDFYLVDTNTWVEIKGRFLDDALEKWNWFHETFPNSELWNENKLKQLGVKAKW